MRWRHAFLVPAGLLIAGSLILILTAHRARSEAVRQLAASEAHIVELRREVARALFLLREGPEPGAAGTIGRLMGEEGWPDRASTGEAGARAGFIEAIKQELQRDMGLLPLQVLRDRRPSFVELYSYDEDGTSRYGTAGHIGGGFFITVKHGVVALAKDDTDEATGRRITAIRIRHGGRDIAASVVDSGDARKEVDPGDWAIIRAEEPIALPALRVDLSYPYEFADPIFRLGNDYSKGIIPASGYIGQPTPNGLVTCLTDGHPGVSGGGILDRRGILVGIPVGRMQGDFRFSFILPLRQEMFRRVPERHVHAIPAQW